MLLEQLFAPIVELTFTAPLTRVVSSSRGSKSRSLSRMDEATERLIPYLQLPENVLKDRLIQEEQLSRHEHDMAVTAFRVQISTASR